MGRQVIGESSLENCLSVVNWFHGEDDKADAVNLLMFAKALR